MSLLMLGSLHSQISRVEPPNWWVGMEHNTLQLLIHGTDIASYSINLKESEGAQIIAVHPADSPNYVFIDLDLSAVTDAANLELVFSKKGKKSMRYEYELKALEFGSNGIKGFDSSDAIYLITPDRFVNAREDNDRVKGLKEQEVDRSHDYKRHGGDIAGITAAVPYLKSIGMTAVWSSPLLINDMPEQSYHGYAITDFYQVDPRLGSLSEYRELADTLRANGMKLIMDQINNHSGSHHWWMKDLPFNDWINGQEAYLESGQITYSNHSRSAVQDTYAAASDREQMLDGWFVSSMPDLNHRNPFMANYLIQNSIWWIETLGLGGIRQDTYPYNDAQFMSQWAGRITKQYPDFSIVGEEWSYNPLRIGYWLDGASNHDGYDSNLKSVFDFPLQQALTAALLEQEGWNQGLIKWYETLSNDFHYPNPQDLVFMGDNHDMDRLFTQLGEHIHLHQMALALLAVSPRTPQLYYGTEILMQNTAKPHDHGLIRTDFPGGWNGDAVNAFTGEGLSEEAVATQQIFAKLFQFRTTSEALKKGKTLHYAPREGTYVISRYTDDEQVILILNKNREARELLPEQYPELQLEENTLFFDVLSTKNEVLGQRLTIPASSFRLISIRK